MPARTFPSKRDTWLVVLMWITVSIEACVPIFLWLAPRVPLGVQASISVLNAAIVVFILWTMYATDYTVEDEQLIVRSGPIRWVIRLSDIESVTPTSNMLSSPAWSLDRLAIVYGGKEMRVSPEDKAGFLAALHDASRGLVVEGDSARRK